MADYVSQTDTSTQVIGSHVVIEPTVAALKSAISSYGGKKIIVIPQDDTGFIIDEAIDIEVQKFMLVNYPFRSCPITLTANGYFNYKNADNWDTAPFVFQGLDIDGDGVATRAITTENGTNAKRTNYGQILDCGFQNMHAVGAKTLYMKDTECLTIERCGFGLSRGIQIYLTQSGHRSIGNGVYRNNFITCVDDWTSPSNGAIGVQVECLGTSGGLGGGRWSENQFYGVAETVDSLAYKIINKSGLEIGKLSSDNDRFEMCRILETDSGGDWASVGGLQILDMYHSTNYADAAQYMVYFDTDVVACFISGGYTSCGGNQHVDSSFLGADCNGTNSQYCVIRHVQGNWAKTVGANKSFVRVPDASALRLIIHQVWGSDGMMTDAP